MKKEPEYKPINLKKALAKMKWWAKEKNRRWLEQKKLTEKLFGPLGKKFLHLSKIYII
jgi:hypothetical protein